MIPAESAAELDTRSLFEDFDSLQAAETGLTRESALLILTNLSQSFESRSRKKSEEDFALIIPVPVRLYQLPARIESHSFQIEDDGLTALVKNQYSCQNCNRIFKSSKGLKQHQGKVHANKVRNSTCEFCNKKFYHKHALKFHVDQVHLKVTRKDCLVCGRSFYNKYSLQEHYPRCSA